MYLQVIAVCLDVNDIGKIDLNQATVHLYKDVRVGFNGSFESALSAAVGA